MVKTADLKINSRLVAFLGKRWALIFLILEAILFSIIARNFFSVNVVQIIFFYGTSIFLLGTAETFVIITGGIDLSVGFVMGFASIVSAKLIVFLNSSGLSPGLSIVAGVLITLAIGLIPGYVNGTLVARLKVPPFIATFSMLAITHGTSELLIKGVPAKNLPYLANAIGNGYLLYYVPGKAISLFVKPAIERGEYFLELIPNGKSATVPKAAAPPPPGPPPACRSSSVNPAACSRSRRYPQALR